MKSAEEDAFGFTPNARLSLPLAPCLPSQYHRPPYDPQEDLRGRGFYSSPGAGPNGAPALESPRIEITAYAPFPEEEVEQRELPVARRVESVVTLTLPGADGYRDPACLSPASSVSSRHSDASSYESGFSYHYENSPQNSPWQSPCVSPGGPGGPALAPPTDGCASPHAGGTEDWLGQRGSRSNSPCGAKRKYSFNGGGASPKPSPGPSPQTSPRLSVTEETWLPNTNQYTNSAILAAINALTTDGMADLGEGIPTKARKTSQDPDPTVGLKTEPGGAEPNPGESLKKEFLDVPQPPYSWSRPKQYVSPTQPALDWQLPSSAGPLSLQVEVQPKSHHRAHYETEGSRGAVKAPAGGHPVVQLHGYMENEPLTLQLFIGTADDRLLRPHAFYQVHRITGKTVSTPSHEALHNNTKVLEIPLLPENNMRAMIDCAGILKLRNSDIELRKGETDIGRKNTRVRMIFRVHINQASGRTVSLQVASNPVECSQRSAQELPLVDKQSLQTCPASGGATMLLDGHNFQHDSKVVFMEKAEDGRHLWETEAKVDRDASKSNSLLVEVPPYRTQTLSSPVHVNFYVCNGKRKRSQSQRFTYVAASVPTIKTEPHDDYRVCGQRGPEPYFPTRAVTPMTSELKLCVVGGAYSVSQQRMTARPSPPSPNTSPKMLPSFSKCLPAGRVVQHSIIQETPGRHRPPDLHQSSSSSSSPSPRPSTPTRCITPEQPGGAGTITGAQQDPKVPEGGGASLQEDSSAPTAAVSIKQEPQELDQMYLDDVNEIIRNDLSSISVHGHA